MEVTAKKSSTADILALILAGQQEQSARLARLEGGAIVKGDDGKGVVLAGKAGSEAMVLNHQSKSSLLSELVAFVPQGSHVVGEYTSKRSGKVITNISRGYNTPSVTLAENGKVDLLALGLALKTRKEELISDVAMVEGVERWLADKISKVNPANIETPKV